VSYSVFFLVVLGARFLAAALIFSFWTARLYVGEFSSVTLIGGPGSGVGVRGITAAWAGGGAGGACFGSKY